MSKETKHRKTDWKGLILELIVVFLGVTAGFLLNNWSSSKNDSQLEEKYLRGFLEDINNDIAELTENVKNDSLWLAKAEPFVHSFQKSEKIHPDSAIQMLSLMAVISKLDSRNATYIDIVNSGNLNLIQDFDLKSKIVDYYVDKENSKFIDEFLYEFFNTFSLPLIIKEFDIVTFSFTNPKIINSADFRNTYINHVSLINQRKEIYDRLLSKGISLKEQLEKNN